MLTSTKENFLLAGPETGREIVDEAAHSRGRDRDDDHLRTVGGVSAALCNPRQEGARNAAGGL